MAVFRPNKKKEGTSTSSYLGFMEAGIVDFSDRSDEFEWADVFIDVTFNTPNSQYPVIYNLKGTYNRDADGKIESCPMLNRIYYLLDAIGCDAGPNVDGIWEDQNGNKIPKVDTFLNNNFLPANALTDETYPYFIYVYKEWNKDKQKAYTRVSPKIVKNDTRGHTDLKSYIAFLRQKGLLKEYKEDSQETSTLTPKVSSDTQPSTF